MRRLVIFCLTMLLATPVFSQETASVPRDSLTQSLELDNLRKIAFKDGNVVTTYADGITRSHRISGSGKLLFSVPGSDDNGISEGENTYTIYDLSGRPVKAHTDKSCDQPFDLSDLPSGIYLLKTGNRTIKIIK